MPARILIIDGVSTNRIILKVKLSAAFYRVSQASDLNEARDLLPRLRPDLILVSDTLLGGENALGGLQNGQDAGRIPIVAITEQDSTAHRVAALRAGADDVLSKPMVVGLLLARLRTLLRQRDMNEELVARGQTAGSLGFAETPAEFEGPARVVLATGDAATCAAWQSRLAAISPYRLNAFDHAGALERVTDGSVPDAFVIELDPADSEPGLRLLAEIRARSATRRAAVMLVAARQSEDEAIDGLDLGAGAVMTGGFSAEEAALRLGVLIGRKRLGDRLRRNVEAGLEAAVTDPLTGLFNRRYALQQLTHMAIRSSETGRNYAVMVVDLDHFKSINDRWGHAFGDAVLAEVAARLRYALRRTPGALVARIGGEEFLILLPDCTRKSARRIADTVCRTIRRHPFTLPDKDVQAVVTASIGVAMGRDHASRSPDNTAALLDHADRALYGAKAHGRNQVTLDQPVA